MTGIPRCVTEAFYRVRSLEGSGGNPSVAEKGFRAFKRAEMSPQGPQLNTISYIFLPTSN